MSPTFRRFSAFLPALALAAGAALVSTASAPSATVDADDLTPVFAPGCIGYCKHPTNAAKVFRWGVEDWRQEFEDRSTQQVTNNWKSDHPNLLTQQVGMLTIAAKPDTGSVKVWADDQAASTGRWEARVRAVNKTSDAESYTYTWELVPAEGPACGKRIVMAQYKPGDERVQGWVENGDTNFKFSRATDLRSRAWHTYAVEVTKDHISWFSDTKVRRTERRPAALSGVKLKPQFRIEGPGYTEMNSSWMQMDWARYYSLKRENAHSIDARKMNKEPAATSC